MTKKIAIFHNYMDNIGGAEMVSLTMARELGAYIYTTNISSKKIIKMGFEDVLPRIFSIGKIPINAPLKQQIALCRFRFLKLGNKYDFYIIGGDWAMSGAVNNRPNLWYIHSPIREIWDLYKYVRKNSVPAILRPIFDIWVHYNRYLNRKYLKSVDNMVCNSKNTQARVKKYLNKIVPVLNPPIFTSEFGPSEDPTKNTTEKEDAGGEYWLSVNRLLNQKRVDMQLNAFRKLPDEKLIIVGSYEQSRHFKEYADYCQKIKPENVEIKSWVPRTELVRLYSNCKGFITTSEDEDFGMNVVEAMASGKPVIAPNEGGYRESVIDGKTGILIDNINEEKLIESTKKLGSILKSEPFKYKDASIEQARKFDTKIFIENVRKIIG